MIERKINPSSSMKSINGSPPAEKSPTSAMRDVALTINFSEYQEKRNEREALRDQIRSVLNTGSNNNSVSIQGKSIEEQAGTGEGDAAEASVSVKELGGFRPLGEKP